MTLKAAAPLKRLHELESLSAPSNWQRHEVELRSMPAGKRSSTLRTKAMTRTILKTLSLAVVVTALSANVA